MAITKQAFKDWSELSITKAYKTAMQEAVEAMAATIITRRESNPTDDQFLKGSIKGIVECLEWEPEYVEDREV